jgi:hypothetical protein
MLEEGGGEPDVIEAAAKIDKVKGGVETLFTIAAQAALDVGGKKNSNKGLRLYCLGGKVEAAKGGSTRAAAERTRRAGRGDDEILMHVTPDEAQILEGMWGKPQTNPNTGMPEYGFFKKAWKKIKSGVRKVVASKAFGTIAPIVLGMIPGIGPALGIALQAGLGAITAQARGEKPLLGAVSGAAAGAGSAIGKAASTAAKAGTLTLKQKIGAGVGKALAKGVGAAAEAGDIRAFAPGVIGSGLQQGMGAGLGALTQAFAPPGTTPGQSLVPQQPGVSAPGGTSTVAQLAQAAKSGYTSAPATSPMQFLPSNIAISSPGPMTPRWKELLKKWGPMAGAGALALASGLGGGEEDEGRPPSEYVGNFDESLPMYSMNRQFRGLPNVEDYFTYGQAGSPYSGQHLFLEPDPFPAEEPPSEAAGGYVGGAGGLGAIGQQSDDQLRAQLYGPGMQRGGEFDYWEQNEDIGNAIPTVSAQGRYVRGPGTGRSDDIEARLSDGEYVMDAETVALLGDGSSDEGARRLDAMRSNLRKHKGENLHKGKFSHKAKEPAKYMNKVHGGKVKLKRKRTYEHGGVHNVPRATGGTI